MAHRINKVLTTANKKLGADFSFTDPSLPSDFEMPKEANVAVGVGVEVPDNAEEDEIEDIDDIEELKAFLKARGALVGTGS